ncbi:MAG: thioredoxin family protein [Pseudomonadota bacterium]
MLLDTPVCDFGARAPEFVLRDPAGMEAGVPMSVGRKGLLVAFICNHCPYVKGIADRLSEDLNTLQDEGFGVLAVMSNDYAAFPADNPERMTAFAEAHGFRFPYLVDADQSVGRAYGAVCTPDFFGYNAALELQYRGRLDDAGRGDGAGRRPELLEAMRAVGATGRGPEPQVPSMGCSIKWR